MLELKGSVKKFSIEEFPAEERNLREKKQEEIEFHRRTKKETHQVYLAHRLLTQDAAKAIVEEIFETFVPEDAHCAEFGSGAYGCLYNLYLPKKWRRTWQQWEINTEFVKSNKWFTMQHFWHWPRVDIGNIYAMPLEDASIDCIVGLSSWDCLGDFERAMEEVYRCLKPNGLFIHMQDLRPAESPLLIEEAKKRAMYGLPEEFYVEMWKEEKNPIPGLYVWNDYVIGIESIRESNKMIRIGEYLTKHLRAVCQESGLEILFCGEKIEERRVERERYERILGKFGYYFPPKENVCITRRGSQICYDPEIKNNEIFQWAAMDVLIAQK